MTVLGTGKEKSDDKEVLVGKVDVATILPNRMRLIKLQRRRSIITLLLSIGFLFIFLCGIFLTVCFIKKIGPFRQHFMGRCPVGSKRFNGHSRIFESYEITDKYALIHVPKFNFKHGVFDSVRTLHVFDKKLTVIQHNSVCFVKPMMRYQILRSDWFDKLRMLAHHQFRTPNRFAHYHLQIVRPQLPNNFLRDEVHHLADAMCNSRPVFRLKFQIHPNPYQWSRSCNIKCKSDCAVSDQVNTWRIIGHRKCKVCQCQKPMTKDDHPPLQSSNQVDANCKSIRCENKCADKKLLGCVQCRCADADQVEMNDLVNLSTGNPFDKHENNPNYSTEPTNKDYDKLSTSEDLVIPTTEQPLLEERNRFKPIFDYESINRKKRSANNNCRVVAKIFEGYTPLDYDMRAPLDYIHDC